MLKKTNVFLWLTNEKDNLRQFMVSQEDANATGNPLDYCTSEK